MQTNSRRIEPLALLLGAALLLGGCGDDAPASPLRPGEADNWANAVSHILIRIGEDGTDEPEARTKAFEVWNQLADGASFAELAAKHSDHASSTIGGFQGFVRITNDTRFSGAVQALSPGQFSRPVRTDLGYQILLRHSLDEGAALERKFMIVVHGFPLPYQEIEPRAPLTREQAKGVAAELYADLKRGGISLLEARAKFGVPGPDERPDTFLMVTANRPDRHELFEAVSAVEPGEFVPPFDSPQGFAILRRGSLLRAVARHIVVRHIETTPRDIRIRRTRDEARSVAEQALSELLPDRSNWDDLVRRFTDDDTKLRPSGTVGLVGPGEMPPPVEQALLDTAPGDVHPEVVESLFGFHVLWRVR